MKVTIPMIKEALMYLFLTQQDFTGTFTLTDEEGLKDELGQDPTNIYLPITIRNKKNDHTFLGDVGCKLSWDDTDITVEITQFYEVKVEITDPFTCISMIAEGVEVDSDSIDDYIREQVEKVATIEMTAKWEDFLPTKQFMCFWGEGYGKKDPQTVCLPFFNQGNGFTEEDLDIIKRLEPGESHNFGDHGPMSVVRLS